AIRRDRLSATGARTSLLPYAVRGEALQSHSVDRSARISGLPVLPRANAGGRHDRSKRPDACSGSLPHEPGGERGRHRGSERQLDGDQEPALQGSGDVSEAAVHVRYALRTRAPDVRGADRLRDQRARAERIRPSEPAGSAGHVLPRRSGVRGGEAMTANAAFAAALTTFLIVAWMAGELAFL